MIVQPLIMKIRQGSNERDSSSSTERSSRVILSAAKDLCSRRVKPFAEFTLERSEGLRVTRCDCSHCQVQFAQIEPCLNLLNLAIGEGSIVVAPLAGAMSACRCHARFRAMCTSYYCHCYPLCPTLWVPCPLPRDAYRTFAAGRVNCRFLSYSG